MASHKVLILSIVSVFLSACGSISNKTGVDRLPSGALFAQDKGVVVFSAGAPERCMAFSTFLTLREIESKKVVDSVPSIGVDVYVHKSDFAGHHGTLNALQLSPGSYSLTPMIMNPYVKSVVAPTFEFEVNAGEVAYLGELFMTVSCGLRTSFVVRDYYERDMPIAMARSPEIATRVAVKRLLRSGSPAR
jgi:hypothetical protein